MTPEQRQRALTINDKAAADRVLQQVRWSSGRAALHDDPFPTTRQIACVMHALADYTHNLHMLSDEVAALGEDAYLDMQATALGRYFHALGDAMETTAFIDEQAAGKWPTTDHLKKNGPARRANDATGPQTDPLNTGGPS